MSTRKRPAAPKLSTIRPSEAPGGVTPSPAPSASPEPSFPSRWKNAELTPLTEIHAHPRNYRTHPADQIAHLIASITKHGFYRPVVAARDGTILAGHGITVAAEKMGLKAVPVIRLPLDPNSPTALKILTGDNEMGKLAQIDDRMLTELLRGIKDTDPEALLGTGFDEKMLAALAMVTRPAGKIADIDDAAAWAGMPEFGEKDEDVKLTILFRNPQDRDKFIAEKRVKVSTYKTKNAWTTWYPEKPRDDLISLKFQEAAQ